MKAKIRKTGEIVDIICYNQYSTIRSHQDYVSYIDSKGIEHDRELLNYYWDFDLDSLFLIVVLLLGNSHHYYLIFFVKESYEDFFLWYF